MTNRDLENLKHLPVPPPRDAARTAAIDAAMAAFDAAQSENPATTPATTQGNVVPLRQTETSQPKRSFFMRITSRQNLALAASLAALMIAAPMAFRMTQGELQGTFGSVSTEMASRGAGTTTTPAPAQIEIARVEPAPVTQPRPSPVDHPTIADARRVDEGLVAKKSEDLEMQAAAPKPAEGRGALDGTPKAKQFAGKQSLGAGGASVEIRPEAAPAAPAAIASIELDASRAGASPTPRTTIARATSSIT